jgi:hypothetical protein
MKRDPALVPLSHEHQHALDVALRLRRATADNLDAALARLREFWREEGSEHFDLEERALTPELCARDPRWAPGVERMLAEHVEVRSRADAIAAVEDAHALGELLNRHIRFEERELFPIIEETLSDDELARLGAALA